MWFSLIEAFMINLILKSKSIQKPIGEVSCLGGHSSCHPKAPLLEFVTILILFNYI